MQGKHYIGLCCYKILWPLSLHSIAAIPPLYKHGSGRWFSDLIIINLWLSLSLSLRLTLEVRFIPKLPYQGRFEQGHTYMPSRSVLDLVAAVCNSYLLTLTTRVTIKLIVLAMKICSFDHIEIWFIVTYYKSMAWNKPDITMIGAFLFLVFLLLY